eukprot:562069-Rhodomonas_salina.1
MEREGVCGVQRADLSRGGGNVLGGDAPFAPLSQHGIWAQHHRRALALRRLCPHPSVDRERLSCPKDLLSLCPRPCSALLLGAATQPHTS